MTTVTRILKFKLLSDATFGKGEGLPGLLDQEVEHDDLGLPYLRGRTLRGLLAEEIEAILSVVDDAPWRESRDRLLGKGGALDDETGIMHVGDVRLSENLRRIIALSIQTERPDHDKRLTAASVLNSLTTVRRQTAMTPDGAPDHGSLRAMRVVLRGTVFESELSFDTEPTDDDIALLCVGVLALRRAGSGRNRGRGRIKAWLKDESFTRDGFNHFSEIVQKS